MRKIDALKIEHAYANAPDSQEKMKRGYARIINMAIDNLLKRQKGIDNNSTQKYTVSNGQSRDLPDTGRSSQNTQSQKDHHLQDVQSRQIAGSKVWQGLENKQQQTNESIGG